MQDGIETEQEQEQPASRRDDLMAAYEASQAPQEPQDTDLETEQPQEPTQAQRVRDPHGRFAKKVSEEAQAPRVETGTEPTSGVTEEAAKAAPITAPVSVPGELRKNWNQLPPEWQQWTAKRELETQQKLSHQGREVAELREVIKQHAPDWEVRGFGPVEALRQYIGWSKRLETNPVQAAIELAANYGVQPQHFAHYLQTGAMQQVQHQPQQQEFRDPRVDAWMEQQQQQQIAQAQSELERFADERDESGNLKHAYWLEAYPYMQSIAAGLRQRHPTASARELLEMTYSAAVAASPELRAKADADRERARQVRERQTVEQARRMGSSIKGAPNGSGVAPKQYASRKEELWAAYRGEI